MQPYTEAERLEIATEIRKFADGGIKEVLIDMGGIDFAFSIPLTPECIKRLHITAYEIQHGSKYREEESN